MDWLEDCGFGISMIRELVRKISREDVNRSFQMGKGCEDSFVTYKNSHQKEGFNNQVNRMLCSKDNQTLPSYSCDCLIGQMNKVTVVVEEG